MKSFGLPVFFAAVIACQHPSLGQKVDFEDLSPGISYAAGSFGISQGITFTAGPSTYGSGCCAAVTDNGQVNGSHELVIDSLLATFHMGAASEVRLDYKFASQFQPTEVELRLSDGTFYVGDVMGAPSPFIVDGGPQMGTITYHGPTVNWLGIGGVDLLIDDIRFSNEPSAASGDLNGDGSVDAADAAQMFRQWTGDSGPARSVPEPVSSSIAMLVACAAWTSFRRRIGRHLS